MNPPFPEFNLIIDHLQREVYLPSNPQRIVSLCPSQTETLFTLGLGDKIVGRTLFCIHPHEVKRVASVGGTKIIDPAKILALAPDLVIAEKEENTLELVKALEKKVPVFVTEVQDFQSALKMIRDLGFICGKGKNGNDLALAVEKSLLSVPVFNRPLKTVYLIWRDPWMAVGNETFIHAMLERLGLENVCANLNSRYPALTSEQLVHIQPELVLLSSEPFPFKEKHIQELKEILPGAAISLVDGEIFSWYGSRLLHATDYFNQLIPALQLNT